jgi:hypothetical protein
MHRLIQDHLEEVLAEPVEPPAASGSAALEHLEQCEECRSEVESMRAHAAMLHVLRTSEESVAALEPRPGFYARVMERIDAQRATSIWQLFFESAFGRRLAVASMALVLLMGVYLVSGDQFHETRYTSESTVQFLPGEDQPGTVLSPSGPPDKDSVLVNLVTYRQQ